MPRLKSIIWFVYQFESPGGGERWILEAEKVLNRKGVKTHIICVTYDEKVLFNHTYDVIVKVLQKKTPKLGGFVQKSIRFLSMVKSLRSEIKLIKPDMVMSQGLREYVITFLATRFTGTKYSNMDFGQLYQIDGINIIHSYFYKPHLLKIAGWMEARGEKLDLSLHLLTLKQRVQNEYKGILLYLSYRNAAHIFTLSEKVKREVQLIYSRDAVVLRGAYDKKIFKHTKPEINPSRPNEKKSIILTIGRLVPHKRVELIIRAIDILRHNSVEFIFKIGGTGPEIDTLKHLCSQLQVDKYVEFMGYVEETTLIDHYLGCDVFAVMDSADFDITPMVALALGKRVVCPDIMEFSKEIESSGQLFRSRPEPQEVARALFASLASQGEITIPTEDTHYNDYTWDSCFTKMYNAWNG